MNSNDLKLSLKLVLRNNLFNLKDFYVKEIKFHLLLAKSEIARLNKESDSFKYKLLRYIGINHNKEIEKLKTFRDSFAWIETYENNRVLRKQEREAINHLYDEV